MINQQLLNPKSIVVIGGSNNVHKPGGAIVRNIKNGGFGGPLHIVNPKEDEVQGIKAYHDVKDTFIARSSCVQSAGRTGGNCPSPD